MTYVETTVPNWFILNLKVIQATRKHTMAICDSFGACQKKDLEYTSATTANHYHSKFCDISKRMQASASHFNIHIKRN